MAQSIPYRLFIISDIAAEIVERSASWQTPMKEIIKGTIVIDPPFGSWATLVKVNIIDARP